MIDTFFTKKNILPVLAIFMLSFCACKNQTSETPPLKKEETKAITAPPKPEIQKDISREIYYGVAVIYDDKRQGNITTNRDFYDKDKFTAAVRINAVPVPLGTVVEVFNKKTKKRVRVKVNDEMNKRSVNIIELSRVAAEALDIIEEGSGNVIVQAVKGQETGIVEK